MKERITDEKKKGLLNVQWVIKKHQTEDRWNREVCWSDLPRVSTVTVFMDVFGERPLSSVDKQWLLMIMLCQLIQTQSNFLSLFYIFHNVSVIHVLVFLRKVVRYAPISHTVHPVLVFACSSDCHHQTCVLSSLLSLTNLFIHTYGN